MGNTTSDEFGIIKSTSYSTLNLNKKLNVYAKDKKLNEFVGKSKRKSASTSSLSSIAKNGYDKKLKHFIIGYSLVELSRSNGSQFGLTIAGGTDKDSRPRICDLKAGSIAHRSDELQIGDMIMSINGIKTQGLKHEEIIDLIKNAGDALCLEFEYNLPPWPIHPHHAVRSQTVHIQLEKENHSYGFTIRGGSSEDKIKSRPLIVTNIRAGGPADREGTLKIGDRIIAINGINVINASLQEANFIIKQCKGLTLFLVEYDSAIVDSIKNSSGPLLIEIEKSPGSSIGIKLTSTKSPQTGKNQILVEWVKPASIADRCGAIYVGDQILSIDDVSFEHVTLAEANQILKNCIGEFSRVEILPLSQMMSNKTPSSKSSKSLVDLNKEYRLVDMQKFGSINSCSASLNTNQVSHPETVEINLKADENGTFGFTLQGAGIVMTSNHMNEVVQNIVPFPVIGYVEPNSAAERCGIMQPGDRIILVNNRSLEGLSLEEARQIIKEAGSNLQLEIEFDVQDTIMLTSGIFQVKILKKNLDLGIVVAYPRYLKSENYPYISEIKKGSAAYRSGMLQPGDRILFIDNSSLRNKSITEIINLLKSTDEIVKLKIKKDELYTEDNADNVVVYTVEMQRNGGPLGITISGSDDLFEPMFVSGLTEGGLAERTNAIHVGDVILAINNVSLRGKTLTEAIELLQNADDAVTLKISRKIDKTSMRIDDYLQSNQQKLNNNSFNLNAHQAYRLPIKNIDREDTSSLKSSQYINENSESNENNISNNSNQKTVQYLPFPMDMTNFIRQSHSNAHNESNGNVNTNLHYLNNANGTLKANMSMSNQFTMDEMKRKAASLDSINAVERELDEVLKDLELNSQDLNDQLEENEYLTATAINNSNNNNNNSVEVPISIQKNIKIESSSSSSNSCSSPLNKSYNSNSSFNEKSRQKPSNLMNSEFLRTTCELFIDDVDDRDSSIQANKYQNKSSDDMSKKLLTNGHGNIMQQNGNRKRQNIISTYELCHECFDSNLILSNPDSYQSNGTNCSSKYCSKNTSNSNISNINSNNNNNKNSSPINLNNHHPSQISATSTYNHIVTPLKFASSYSNNQDVPQSPLNTNSNDFNNRNINNNNNNNNNNNRTILSQINESVIPETNKQKQYSLQRNGKLNTLAQITNKSTSNQNLSANNGNVISQKVISIGMPNKILGRELDASPSPSPKLNEQRQGEDKLDKLPPVPPSAWSANSSMRRRNQNYQQSPYLAQNRNKKPSNKIQNFSDFNENGNGIHDKQNEIHVQNEANVYTKSKNYELSIEEPESRSNSDDSNKDNCGLTEFSINNNNNQKNYDNVNMMSEETSNNSDEEDKLELVINKDSKYNDFGFSISDSVYGHGIYINKIRADNSNENLKPYCKVFKINNYDCTKIDIGQANKIMQNEQSNSNYIKLVVSKKPKNIILNDDKMRKTPSSNWDLQNSYAISSCRATAL